MMPISNAGSVQQFNSFAPVEGKPAGKAKYSPTPKGILAKIVNFISKRLFAALRAAVSFDLKKFVASDMGSGGTSERLVSFDDKGVVTIGKKTKPKDEKDDTMTPLQKDLNFIDWRFNAPEDKGLLNAYEATAWARLAKNHPDFIKDKLDERLSGVQYEVESKENGVFSVISQDEEARRVHVALQYLLKQDSKLRGNIDPKQAEAIDGGQRSNQGTCFNQKGGEFGGIAIKDMLVKQGLDNTQKYLDDNFNSFIPKTKGEKVPFFCGSHLFALKNADVMEILKNLKTADGKDKYDMVAWELGESQVEAQDLVDAMTKTINDLNAKYTDAASSDKVKKSALQDLFGMVITNSILKTYINHRGAKVVRMGERIIPKLDDQGNMIKKNGKIVENEDSNIVKATHYLGGAVERYKKANTVWAKFVRGVARVVGE